MASCKHTCISMGTGTPRAASDPHCPTSWHLPSQGWFRKDQILMPQDDTAAHLLGIPSLNRYLERWLLTPGLSLVNQGVGVGVLKRLGIQRPLLAT